MSKLKSLLLFSAVSTILLAAFNTMAQTGDPYFNVKDPAYGARCDGNPLHDDTNAFEAALLAANTAGGGMVYVPLSTGACMIGGQLNIAGYVGVSLAGPNGGIGGDLDSPNVPHPVVNFTGTVSPLINMRGSWGLAIKNLTLQYTNAGFTGTFIDLGGNPSGARFAQIVDSTIQGTPTGSTGAWVCSASAACHANLLFSLDNATDITIERNLFEWAVNGIQGAAMAGHFSNSIRIRDNRFGGFNTTSISGNMILNPFWGWTIAGNTFEMGYKAGTGTSTHPVAINASTVGCVGCQITGNWISDLTTQFSSGLIQGYFQGTSITGNFVDGAIDNVAGSGQGVILTGCAEGTSITGNSFLNLAYAINFQGSCSTDTMVAANSYGGTTHFSSGSPVSGIVKDSTAGVTYVYGNLGVSGSVSKGGGSFKIDDPIDPANKYLSHSFVESPDMMNIYNGVVTLDSNGSAAVTLPSYFEALNQDFRYQLTPVGAFAPLYVAKKIHGNSFGIAGGKSGMEVSWQVTGIRHDAYANANRIVVEEEKPAQQKGQLLYELRDSAKNNPSKRPVLPQTNPNSIQPVAK